MAEPTEVGRFDLVKSVGPNATLIDDDIEAVIRGLKAQYRLYFRPVVLGRGKPFFAGPGRRSALWPTIELARTRLD